MDVRRLLVVSLVAALSAISVPSPALGHQQIKVDGNDTSSSLDLSGAIVDHDGRYIYVSFVTFEPFRSSVLAKSRRGFWVNLDTVGDGKTDYYAAIFFRNGRLKVNCWRDMRGQKEDRFRGRAGIARRISSKVVQVRIKRTCANAWGSYFRWDVMSRVKNKLDWVPSRGYKTHYF